MKNLKIFFTLILSLSILSLKAQHTDHMGHMEPMKHDDGKMQSGHADDMFQTQLGMAIRTAGDLSDAFVSGNPGKVKEAADAVKGALKSVDMALLQGDDHMNWMQYLEDMNNRLSKISESGDIAVQRELFVDFNDTLHKSIKTFGIQGVESYYDFCPMAMNNKGAFWFSNIRGIRNPYFGEKMLTCGQTKEVFE